jgi:hypothetical protein
MAIVVVALIIVGAVDGFLAYRYYDRLDNTRSASIDTVPSRDAAERTESAFEQAETEESRPTDEQDAGRAQQRDGAADEAAVEQKEVASQRDEAEYVGTVGDIQTGAVETFLNSHDKLLQYDALAADDVDELKADENALQDMADQAGDLAPPRKYEEQHKVFGSAIDELHEAARLAYGMAADPVVATELGFDEYDGHVNEASALLQRSNELSGKDYEAIEGVQKISPDF